MISEILIGKDFEGSGSGLSAILSRNSPGGTEEITKYITVVIVGVSVEIQTE
jgi:hypothetical protein